jgi:hypothetical protein
LCEVGESFEGDKRKVVVLRENVFLCEVGASFNAPPGGRSGADLVPRAQQEMRVRILL